MSERIYHLARPSDWETRADEYRPAGFEEEGFIHCSTAGQLRTVARARFMWDNDLIRLTLDAGALGDSLVYEDLDGEGEMFPHVYRPIPTSAILTTVPYLAHLEEGLWLSPYRFDPKWINEVLHPDFTEIGMSGKEHTRAETVGAPAAEIEICLPHEAYQLNLLDGAIAVARYVSIDTYEGVPRRAHRTSIWVNTDRGWRLRFHQGTPMPN